MMLFNGFRQPGLASFVLGGQWGSEGKGAACASLAYELAKRGERFDIVTVNAGAQAGHTSVHNGVTRVVFHLPTASLVARQELGSIGLIYLNAGAIIDPKGLMKEIWDNEIGVLDLAIHPNAAIITQECKDAENRADSAQTKIASTRKGVGEALSRKVLRSGMLAKDHPDLAPYVRRINLNHEMAGGSSVLVEIPQGIGLSVDEQFYPHCTSRNCTVAQGMSDAGIHPWYYNQTMLVLRTFPIRVGNIMENGEQLGQSGGCYPDQHEIWWSDLGKKAEITTVTKRVRRVFTFSVEQCRNALAVSRPDVVYLTFCDYLGDSHDVQALVREIENASARVGINPEIVYQYGPSTHDVFDTIRRA